MSKIPALKPIEVIKILKKAGFKFIRQKGSHQIYLKNNRAVTVPYHNSDLRKGTLIAIIKQSGLTLREFIHLK